MAETVITFISLPRTILCWPVLSSKERKKGRKTFVIYRYPNVSNGRNLVKKRILRDSHAGVQDDHYKRAFTTNRDRIYSKFRPEALLETNFIVLLQRRRTSTSLSKEGRRGKGRGIIEFPREYGKICCFPHEKLTRAGNISRSFSTLRFHVPASSS